MMIDEDAATILAAQGMCTRRGKKGIGLGPGETVRPGRCQGSGFFPIR
jgi:hypothetical protein